MENASVRSGGLENGALTRATLLDSDPPRTTGCSEEISAVAATILPTAALRECDTKAFESLFPSVVMQENIAATANTTTTGGRLALKKPLPFRERNMEEGRRLLPPHITVPPKKLFGYPERYRSPTDAMVSPVSRGLLTRNRRPAGTLSPMVPPKALENTFQDVVVDAVGGDLD